jgi:hypothetical protein
MMKTKTLGKITTAIAFILILAFVPLAYASTSVSSSTFSAPSYPYYMNLYLMDSGRGITSTTPLNYEATPTQNATTQVSLSGFKNNTINSGASTLVISEGNHGKTILLGFTEGSASGVVGIATSLVQNPQTKLYASTMLVYLNPSSKDLNLGDMFVLNYSSTFSNQLNGLSAGLGQVAKSYEHTGNATLNLLGHYYSAIQQGIGAMRGMLPSSVGSVKVASTSALVIDINAYLCALQFAILAAELAAEAFYCAFPEVLVTWIACILWTAAVAAATDAWLVACGIE